MGHVTIINCFIFLEKQLKMGRRDDIQLLPSFVFFTIVLIAAAGICSEGRTKIFSLEVIT